MDSQELLDSTTLKISQILHLSYGQIDKNQLVVLYSLLNILYGGNEEHMRLWLNTHDKNLNFCPAAYLTDNNYLKKIIKHLDSLILN